MGNNLGDFVRGIRTKRGVSLREMARLCDLSHTYLGAIEKGFDIRTGKKVSITTLTLEKLANGLGVGIEDLFSLTLDRDPRNRRNIDYLTAEEIALIQYYRKATPEERQILLRILRA